MNTRWILIVLAAAAFVVALTWLPIRPGTGGGDAAVATDAAAGGQSGSSSCGPDAPAADLSFTLKDMDGRDVRFADYKGKVLLLNFWATWCPPCKAEIPEFVDVQQQYRGRGFEILGISVDDPFEKLRPFADEYKVNYPLLFGADRGDVQEAFGPMFGVPISVLVARDGRICKRFVGPVSKSRLERELKALL